MKAPQASLWNLFQGMALQQGYADIGGIRTRYVRAGYGEPLLMLHGNGGHLEANLRAMAMLADAFEVFAIDMLSHGYTDAPSDEVTPQAYVDHVRGFLDVMNIDKAHIAGVSLGARIALWVALACPDRVLRVVANTGLPLAPATEEDAAEMRAAQQRSLKVTEDLTYENMLMRLRGVIGDDANIPDELIECRYRIYQQPGLAQIINRLHYQNYETMLTSNNAPPWFGFEVLGKIKAPVLVLWSDNNPGHSIDTAKAAVEALPDARLAIIPATKHWPQWENAEGFVAEVRPFLKGQA